MFLGIYTFEKTAFKQTCKEGRGRAAGYLRDEHSRQMDRAQRPESGSEPGVRKQQQRIAWLQQSEQRKGWEAKRQRKVLAATERTLSHDLRWKSPLKVDWSVFK